MKNKGVSISVDQSKLENLHCDNCISAILQVAYSAKVIPPLLNPDKAAAQKNKPGLVCSQYMVCSSCGVPADVVAAEMMKKRENTTPGIQLLSGPIKA